MIIEDQLRERLRKVEALYFGAASGGEREAAGAAAERLKAKLDEAARNIGFVATVSARALKVEGSSPSGHAEDGRLLPLIIRSIVRAHRSSARRFSMTRAYIS